MSGHPRLRGLVSLVADAVEHGSRGVEQVHTTIGTRPFRLAAQVPALSAPADAARVVYERSVGATYSLVRLGNRAVKRAADLALDLAEARAEAEANAAAATAASPPAATTDPEAPPQPE